MSLKNKSTENEVKCVEKVKRKNKKYTININQQIVTDIRKKLRRNRRRIQMNELKPLRRCKQCSGCLRPDCGECKYCKDKIKFGGKGLQKQACVHKKCNNSVNMKMKETREKFEQEIEDSSSSEKIIADPKMEYLRGLNLVAKNLNKL